MSPRTRQIIIGIAFVAAVIYGIGEFTGADDKTARPVNPQPNMPTATANPQASNKGILDTEKYEQLPWGRDPFYLARNEKTTAPAPSSTPVTWTLNGILFNALSPSAVINKRVVKPGDRINGARVVKIDKRQVTLEKDGAQIVLHIHKETS